MSFFKLLGLVCAALVSASSSAAEEKPAASAEPVATAPAADQTLFTRVNHVYKKSAKQISSKI